MSLFTAESNMQMCNSVLENYKEKKRALEKVPQTFSTAGRTKPESLKRVAVFKLDMKNDREKFRAMKKVVEVSGVESISADKVNSTLTVIGDVDPVEIVRKLRKLLGKAVEIVSVGRGNKYKNKNPEPEVTGISSDSSNHYGLQKSLRDDDEEDVASDSSKTILRWIRCIKESIRKMMHGKDDHDLTWSSPVKKFKTYHYNSFMDTRAQYMIVVKSPSFQICAHNFVALFFPYFNLNQLWKGGNQLLVSLKSIDLSHSSNLLSIPDLSKAQRLESLSLEGCESLVGVSSIQYLTSLQHLNLKRCQSLKRLPSLIRLKLLKTLDLSHCSNLTTLPPSLGCLSNLCELNLRNCVKLDHLPASVIHLMTCLETLNISGCSSLWKSIDGTQQDNLKTGTAETCPQDLKHVDFDESFMATPLIDFLPSELRSSLFPSSDIKDEKAAVLEMEMIDEEEMPWLAELEQSIPETVKSDNDEKLKEIDARLTAGGLELSFLDEELSRILEEEEEIEAELQRLMSMKSETVQY